jgi:hypothetical protein
MPLGEHIFDIMRTTTSRFIVCDREQVLASDRDVKVELSHPIHLVDGNKPKIVIEMLTEVDRAVDVSVR